MWNKLGNMNERKRCRMNKVHAAQPTCTQIFKFQESCICNDTDKAKSYEMGNTRSHKLAFGKPTPGSY